MDMNELRNEFERISNTPYAREKHSREYDTILSRYQVASCIENSVGEIALDFPCGDGVLTELLAAHFKTVVGVDASEKHLEEARRRLPGVEFHLSLMENFTCHRQFDSVIMINILEHVVDPVAILQKAAELLNQEGVIIVQVPNACAMNRKIAVKMGTLDIAVAGHRRNYSLATLRADIEQAGLKIARTGGVFYKMLSTPQMNWFLENGLWKDGYGWGRVGAEESKDWKVEFCRACYEIGKEYPEECNVIYAVIRK
jgi:2-polyprenyl-3-methyl-5-hydroxy-6-metoxy-1,4-benzoquinol methylase